MVTPPTSLLTLGACAARVTVLGLSVCLSTLTPELRATQRPMTNTDGPSATAARNELWPISRTGPRSRARNSRRRVVQIRGPAQYLVVDACVFINTTRRHVNPDGRPHTRAPRPWSSADRATTASQFVRIRRQSQGQCLPDHHSSYKLTITV